MSDWIEVATTEDLKPGESRVVEVDDIMVAVFNLGGEYHAIEDVCTHDGAPLAEGFVDGDQIICPRHGARFCIKTGQALTPPAYEPIATFPVTVEDGVIKVRDERWD